MTDIDDIQRIRDNMQSMQREAESLLAAQRLAAGDDTHYFRDSLIRYHMWLTPCDKATAEAYIDMYLDEAGRLDPLRRARLKVRKIITGDRVDRRSTPVQIAAAWRCLFAGIRLGR